MKVATEVANTPDAEVDAVGLEYRAQAHAAEQPAQKAVAQLEAANAPAADLEGMTHQELAELLWLAASLLLPKLDERLVYTPAEQAMLAKPTAAVLKKYMPSDLLPPELALAGMFAICTAPKLMTPKKAEEPKPVEAPAPKPSEAA